ncbi:MAG: NHL repeat-containing protein [Phycisphaerae bacterium]|nr:NHL repeat-containing protein [Phycisphaerae bacterium]
MTYRQVRIIGGRGPGPDQFETLLSGLAVGPKDELHVAADGQVKVFDPAGRLLRQWKTEKLGYCVAVQSDGTVWVGQVGQIEKFDSSGKRIDTWKDAARLGLVTSIGFIDHSVLVADCADRCIRCYTSGGVWQNDIGKKNNTRGFILPNGHLDFAIDASGVIHACHPGKHRVERYARDGLLLGHFGRFGMAKPEDFPGCCNPTNLALSPQGDVIVTEKAPPRMKVYNGRGELQAWVGPEGFDPNGKNNDVVVDSSRRIYVADTPRLRVVMFEPEGAAPAGNRPATTRESVGR